MAKAPQLVTREWRLLRSRVSNAKVPLSGGRFGTPVGPGCDALRSSKALKFVVVLRLMISLETS